MLRQNQFYSIGPRSSPKLPNYSGELAVSFTSHQDVDLRSTSLYLRAPKDFIHNQIKSYGGKLNYQITYSGYEMDGKLTRLSFSVTRSPSV